MLNLRAAAVALIVAAVTGCGGAGGAAVTGPGGGTNTGGGGNNNSSCGTNTICMSFSSTDAYSGTGTGSFTPTSLTVTAGSTVSFTNNSGVAHNVVFDANAPAGGDIGVISTGTQTRTFTTAGTYPFHCAIHEGMTGMVTVQ